MPSVAARMVRGSLWISSGRAVVNLISFVGTILLARLLMPADFGLVALGTTILAIVSAVTNLSLASALVQHRDPRDEHFHTAFTLNFARGLLMALLICAAAGPLANLYREPALELLLYALSISVALSGLGNPRMAILSRQLVFWQDFLLSVANRFVTTAVAVAFALYWQSFWALVAGAIAGQAVTVILSYIIMPYRPRIGLAHARELWSFSVWLTLGQAMNTINWRFDQLLVAGLLGRNALGFYSVGDNMAQMVTREATSPLARTVFPAFARIAHDGDRLRLGYQRAQRLVTAIALPVGVGFAFVAEPFVLAAMGAKWEPAVPVIQALAAVFALQTLGTLAQPLGMAKGETKLLFWRDVQLFIVRLPVITLAMMTWGLMGLIYARVFTGLLGTGINILLVRQMVGLRIVEQFKVNTRSLTAVAIMSAGLLAMRFLDLHVDATLGGQVMEIIQIVASGAVLYLGSSAVLWLGAGRPDGPERELLTLLAQFRSKVSGSYRHGHDAAS